MSALVDAVAMELESLPVGWTTGVLSDYIERPQYGYTDSATDDPSGTKFLRITDIQDGQVNWHTVPYCRCPPDVLASKRLLPGDVVVARIGATTGKSFYIDRTPDEAVFASYLLRLRAKPEKLLPRYLYFYMQTAEYWAHVDLHKGDRLKGGVNIAVLESLPVVVPPTTEQARIVRALDFMQTAARAEASRATQAAELLGAAMSELFTSGLRGEPQKETDVGPMPESWSPRAIKDLCHIWSGGTPRKSEASYWNGDVPWVSGKDLKAASLDDAMDHLSTEGVKSGSRLAPEDAVLLLVRGMGLAKDLPVAVITRPMAFNQDVKALVSRGTFSGRFLRSAIYAGKARLLRQIARSAHGTMTLNLDDTETFKIACPSDPDEADRIAAILEVIETKTALHLRKRDVLETLLDSLLHELLSGHTSVDELDLSVLPESAGQSTGLQEFAE
jgi:type I restriction enzyme, S subunit